MKYYLLIIFTLQNIQSYSFNFSPVDSTCISFSVDSIYTKNITCNGYNDGQIEIYLSGGSAPYTYDWNTGDSISTIHNLSKGNYSITVRDSLNCEISNSIFISEPDSIKSYVVASAESSYNQQNGKAIAFVNGGYSPYSYFWSNGDSTQVISNLSSGEYNLAVSDSLGCYANTTVKIDTSLTTGNFNFINFPKDLQLYGRNLSNDSAKVTIKGIESSGILKKIDIVIHKDDIPIDFITKELIYDSLGLATFNVECSILSELKNYTFELYTTNNEEFSSLVKMASNIVAGDVIIINGQSNALSKMETTSASSVSSNFIRVFSFGTYSSSALLNNLNWYVGNIDGGTNTLGNTGQFGAKIGYEIIENKQIPVAIFNGAYPNVDISYFKKNLFQPNDLETNYGRLLYRLENTELKDAARAIIWYQGENDSRSNISSQGYYKSLFFLINDWFDDYSNLEYVYIHQIREGCNNNSIDVLEIQEAQRALSKSLDHVKIITSIGVPLYEDNCHYDFIGGSEIIGSRLYQLLNKDLYGQSNLKNVEAPQPQTIFRSGQKELTLVLANKNDNYKLESGTEEYFTFSDSTNYVVEATLTSENNVVLNLNKSVENLNHMSLFGLAGNGTISPSLKNDSNIGIVSFMNFPIADCLNFSIEIKGEDISCKEMNNGKAYVVVQGGKSPYSFNWTNGETTDTIINLSKGVYYCEVEDNYGCKTNSKISINEPDSIIITHTLNTISNFANNAGNISLLINGGNEPYSYNWSTSDTTNEIGNLSFGTYNCNISDLNGCTELYLVTINDTMCDEINVTVYTGDVICYQLNNGSISIDSIQGGIEPYIVSWSNGSNELIADSLTSGAYILELSDSFGCNYSNYYTINENEEIQITSSIMNVNNINEPDGQIELTVTGGVPPYSYFWTNGDTTNCTSNLDIGYYFVTVTDQMDCNATLDSIQVNLNSCPIYYNDLNQPYTTGSIRALRAISSNAYINSSDTIIFTAGERITMNTGFKIEAGVTFRVYNEFCN